MSDIKPVEIIIRDGEDPLNGRSTIGWKADHFAGPIDILGGWRYYELRELMRSGKSHDEIQSQIWAWVEEDDLDSMKFAVRVRTSQELKDDPT